MTSIFVAGLDSLRKDWGRVRALCWSDNTLKTRKSQWRRYCSFCEEYELLPLPATSEIVCLYITHLTKTVSYLTITQYISGVWALHKYLGYSHPDPTSFIIQSTVRGAKRLLGAATNPALPLTPENLVAVFKTLDMAVFHDVIFWAALVLSFRCLLRVGHIVVSPHQLKVSDVVFTSTGMDVIMNSSKTIQYKERVNRIPVLESLRSVLCPVRVLKSYLKLSRRSSAQSLFGYSYSGYNSRLKQACRDIRLVGHYSTHSVRRGAASFVSTFLPLHDVKSYGDWRSWAVLLYLSDTYSSRKLKDELVSSNLGNYM